MIIFPEVLHNLSTYRRLCTDGILMMKKTAGCKMAFLAKLNPAVFQNLKGFGVNFSKTSNSRISSGYLEKMMHSYQVLRRRSPSFNSQRLLKTCDNVRFNNPWLNNSYKPVGNQLCDKTKRLSRNHFPGNHIEKDRR